MATGWLVQRREKKEVTGCCSNALKLCVVSHPISSKETQKPRAAFGQPSVCHRIDSPSGVGKRHARAEPRPDMNHRLLRQHFISCEVYQYQASPPRPCLVSNPEAAIKLLHLGPVEEFYSSLWF